MKQRMIQVCGICLCSAVGLAQLTATAQQAPGTSSTQSQPAGRDSSSQRSDSDGAKVVLQGCLERAPATAANATTSSAPNAGGSFLLTKAERKGPTAAQTLPSSSGSSATTVGQPGAAGSTGAIGTTGANATGGASAAAGALAMSFKLEADASKLSPHVGQRVELSGTIESPGSDARRAGGSTDAQSSGNQSPGGRMSGTPQIFKVDEVKPISGNCS